MAVPPGDNALEFLAPLNVSDELVRLYFGDRTDSQVQCTKHSCIVRVSCINEEALEQISSCDHQLDEECRLTPFLSDSAPLLSQFPEQGESPENSSFVLVSLHVDSRVHITTYCLEDLKTFLNEPLCILHRTPVPGELLLEFRGPVSEWVLNMTVRRIYEYADSFSTAIVEVSEQMAAERLRTLLGERRVNMSCIKISRRCKDDVYIITGKKEEMSTLLYWLPSATAVRQLFLVPVTATDDDPEHNLTAGNLHECGAAAARTEVLEQMEPQRKVTSIDATIVHSRDVAQFKDREFSSSDQPQPALDQDSLPTETPGADQKKTQAVAQAQSQATCHTCPRNKPDSTSCNESAVMLVPNRDPQQQERDFRRTQENQKFNQRGSELSEEACNLSDEQLEYLWLAEQKSNGTLQGWVDLSFPSTTEKRLERKSGDREIEIWLANEKLMGTKPGEVNLRKEGVCSAAGDDSVPQLEQRRKVEYEQQTFEQKSDKDFKKRSVQSNRTPRSQAESCVPSSECDHGNSQVPTHASSFVSGSTNPPRESSV